MVAIKKICIFIFLSVFINLAYAEGSYELRGKSSSNDEVRIESMRDDYTPSETLGLSRVTIFYVDIFDSDNEVIDLYTSNPSQSNDSRDIAVWCPDNTPNNPESATSYNSADEVFNVRTNNNNNSGYISSWNDVVDVQSINTRPRDPKTFDPSDYNCGNGVYTVRFYSHATNTNRSYSNGLYYMDISVRNTSSNTLSSGRVFSKHYSLIQNGYSAELNFKVYVVEGEDLGNSYTGFVWEIDANGIQPYSFQLFANNNGVYPSDYNDSSVLNSSSPSPEVEAEYNIYLNYPDKSVDVPQLTPNVTNFFYHNICEDDNDENGYETGGYFNFYSNGDWKYKLYIDINEDDEVTLDEKVFSGNATSGLNQIYWDGILPDGSVIDNGTVLKFNLYLSDGEIHFPWYDVENRYSDTGPIITLKNATISDSNLYYWNDSPLSGGTTANIDGSSNVRTWGDDLGNVAVIDTWKYAYNSGLDKFVIYGGECDVPDLGGNVSGYVFDDTNHNASKDAGEEGIEDVTIVLHNITNNDCETQKTDSNGYFLFDNILVSEFNLVESATETLPIAYNCPPIEEDPDGYISVDDNTKEVVFNELNASYLTFANFKGYKVSGSTFLDNGLGSNLAHNGIKEATEEDFPNIKIEAISNNSVIETQYTDGGGDFDFWIPSANATVTLKAEEKLDYQNVSSNIGTTNGSKTGYNQITLSGTTQTYEDVLFGYISEPSITASQTKTIQAGTTTTYAHVYKINSIGNVSFELINQTNTPSSNNTNALIYEDQDCDGILDTDSSPTEISNLSVNLNTNNEVCVIVKVLTQTNATNNSSYSFELKATTNYLDIPLVINESVKDITIITDSTNNSNLVLIKSVDKTTALPNEIITYSITARNNGIDVLDNIIINDYTPAFTNFYDADCPDELTSGMTSCYFDSVPNIGETGNIKWKFDGELYSGEEISVFYQVKVDN